MDGRGEKGSRGMIGLDLLGAEATVGHKGDEAVVGAYDLGAEQRQMNRIKPVPVAVARALAAGGLKAIDQATAIAEGKWYETSVPGGTSREKVREHLRWHVDKLRDLADPAAVYASADDLKKWVMVAFIEFNAAEESRARVRANTITRAAGEAWGEMLLDVSRAAAALPGAVGRAVSDAVRGVTGLPIWAWGVLAAGIVGLVGFAAYKILQPAVPIMARAAVDRYLPGR